MALCETYLEENKDQPRILNVAHYALYRMGVDPAKHLRAFTSNPNYYITRLGKRGLPHLEGFARRADGIYEVERIMTYYKLTGAEAESALPFLHELEKKLPGSTANEVTYAIEAIEKAVEERNQDNRQ